MPLIRRGGMLSYSKAWLGSTKAWHPTTWSEFRKLRAPNHQRGRMADLCQSALPRDFPEVGELCRPCRVCGSLGLLGRILPSIQPLLLRMGKFFLAVLVDGRVYKERCHGRANGARRGTNFLVPR